MKLYSDKPIWKIGIMFLHSNRWLLVIIAVLFWKNVIAQNDIVTENAILSEWELANAFGISVGQPNERHWETGRVNDILEIDANTILAAADGGGVWMLRRGGSVAVSYSKNWNAPDMRSLAQYAIPGTNRTLYLAAGTNQAGNGGALYQTNYFSKAPLLENWINIPLNGVGSINKILVLQGLNKIILATDNGIWFCTIPSSGLATQYNFIQAQSFNNYFQPIYDLTETTGNKLVASIKGGNNSSTSTGLFYGTFSGDLLSITTSGLTGLGKSEAGILGTTSVSSCNNAKEIVYALSARTTDGTPLAVFKSSNAGRTFTRIPLVVTNNPMPAFGTSGMYRTNCIDVNPVNPDIVSFGWVTGPYISYNGGSSFMEVSRWLTHDDKACLVFSRLDNNRLYLGCDGGAVSFNSLTNNNYSVDYTWNMRLPTLQFVGPTAIREWWGRMDAILSPTLRMGGGLQDNGVVYSESNSPWKHIQSGFDGSTVLFPACGGLLWANSGLGLRYRRAGSASDDEIPVTLFAPGADRRINRLNGIFCTVGAASTRKRNAAGQNMYAISASLFDMVNGVSSVNNLYGLFANSDGSDMHAEFLYTVASPQVLTSAISSNDPNEIFIGKRTTGKVFRLLWNNARNTYDQTITTGIPEGNDFRIAVGGLIDLPASPRAFAFRNDEFGRGSVYFTSNSADWTLISSGLPAATFYAMDLFKNNCKEILFVATDKAIYATTDQGRNWTNVSYGLPVVPHCSDIHVVPSDNCSSQIYLSTFGWSVWKARIK